MQNFKQSTADTQLEIAAQELVSRVLVARDRSFRRFQNKRRLEQRIEQFMRSQTR
jgi:hypothetical protein